MGLAWPALLLAGLFEIGWPIGLKKGWSEAGLSWPWIGFATVCMVVSGALLLYAQRFIPIGTAYAVWTGIGAAGTFAVGAAVFGEAVTALRLLSILLIVACVAGLKLG
jgi:quaternary ammonium compound-resistance protein SugE